MDEVVDGGIAALELEGQTGCSDVHRSGDGGGGSPVAALDCQISIDPPYLQAAMVGRKDDIKSGKGIMAPSAAQDIGNHGVQRSDKESLGLNNLSRGDVKRDEGWKVVRGKGLGDRGGCTVGNPVSPSRFSPLERFSECGSLVDPGNQGLERALCVEDSCFHDSSGMECEGPE
ncbi:hypothetical protein Dimus_034883 [Dionaea muscipula]